MKFILLEDDWADRGDSLNDIHTIFPSAEVLSFMTAGEFLHKAQEGSDLDGADIVVMEQFLPLWHDGRSEEEQDAVVERFERDFPEVAGEWNHELAGERLVRWMRLVGIQIPILFYTDSDESDIPEDIRRDERVFYCKKSDETGVLPNAIKSIIRKK